MARFEVIKAHDGIGVGTIKSLPHSYITDYMVKNGYWRIIEDEQKPLKAAVGDAPEVVAEKPSRKKNRK